MIRTTLIALFCVALIVVALACLPSPLGTAFNGALLQIAHVLLLVVLVPLTVMVALLVLMSTLTALWAVGVAIAPMQKVPLTYNLRSLTLRWKTTLTTALAFTLVTALLLVMLSFVNGIRQMAQGSGQPGNVVVLSDGATDEVMSNLPGAATVERLPREVQQKILRTGDGKAYLGTKEVYVILSQPLHRPTTMGAMRRLTQMRGVDNPEIAALVHGVHLIKGRWFASSGVPEIVLGEGIANLIAADRGQAAIEPGEEVILGPTTWKVVGIMKTGGTTFDSEIWTSDRKLASKTFGRENSYTSYVLRTAGEEEAREVAREIKDWRAEWSFDAWPETEYYAKFAQTVSFFLFAIVLVAFFMAAGGALGIMNTMFAAISQRRNDIGVLRILGYTRAQVLTSFLLESLGIALLGGLLGCALTVLGFWILSLSNALTVSSMLQSSSGGGRSVVFDLALNGPILLTGMLFSLLMGAVGGLLPAISAMRVRPLESLR
jgi:ABC-type lipoprotein release transport system permease subunit